MDALSFAGFLNWDRMDNDGSGDILKVSKQWGVKFNMETEKNIPDYSFELLFFKVFSFSCCKVWCQDSVAVVGYPTGGESLSVTQGVVSRIDLVERLGSSEVRVELLELPGLAFHHLLDCLERSVAISVFSFASFFMHHFRDSQRYAQTGVTLLAAGALGESTLRSSRSDFDEIC